MSENRRVPGRRQHMSGAAAARHIVGRHVRPLRNDLLAGTRRSNPRTTVMRDPDTRSTIPFGVTGSVCALRSSRCHGARRQDVSGAEESGPQNRKNEELSHGAIQLLRQRYHASAPGWYRTPSGCRNNREREHAMPWMNFAAVGVGAACGAWTRWGLSVLLNPVLPSLPLGTLAANLIGGLLVGVVMGLSEPLSLSATTRLLIVTGFLGGLTTFSSFSAEAVGTLMRGESAWAAALVLAHLLGSLLLTGVGVFIGRVIVSH